MMHLPYQLTPVCFLNDGFLLTYRLGKLHMLDKHGNCVFVKRIVNTVKEKYLAYCSLFFRLFRCGIRTALAIDNEIVLLFLCNKLYEFNCSTGELSAGYTPEQGVRPLYITHIQDIEGFDDMLVWGGYLGNSTKKAVHIYRRIGIDHWQVIFTFEVGKINHIHNIIPDTFNKCVWIFTGDFGDAAGIWQATNNFSQVDLVLGGKQEFRGCVAFPTAQGLLYATDSPFTLNTIRILVKQEEIWNSMEICKIKGSCIYGCCMKEQFVFSTVVESNGGENSFWKKITNRKRGAGIVDDNCHIYQGNLLEGFQDIYTVKKDIYPFIFQFGSIQFPMGNNPTSNLYLHHIATVKNDLHTLVIDCSKSYVKQKKSIAQH